MGVQATFAADFSSFVKAAESADIALKSIGDGSAGVEKALTRMANSENRWLTIGDGDTVILSSHPIPGNEMSVTKVIDGLVRLGAKVVHSGLEDVHATGHAKQEELKTLLNIVGPQWFVPVHGEYRHLVHHDQTPVLVPDDHATPPLPSPYWGEKGHTLPGGSVTRGRAPPLVHVPV